MALPIPGAAPGQPGPGSGGSNLVTIVAELDTVAITPFITVPAQLVYILSDIFVNQGAAPINYTLYVNIDGTDRAITQDPKALAAAAQDRYSFNLAIKAGSTVSGISDTAGTNCFVSYAVYQA